MTRSTFASQNAKKTDRLGALFEVPIPMWEKLRAAVVRSTFASQNAKKLPCLEHFLKFTC